MGLLTIIYWVLLVLWGLGMVFGYEQPWWPRANWALAFVLFVILGLKIIKPTW
jgi:hypothetical protein